LASFHGQDANVFLSDLLRPVMTRMMGEMAEEVSRRVQSVRKSPPDPPARGKRG
jgi:hypothetical protein